MLAAIVRESRDRRGSRGQYARGDVAGIEAARALLNKSGTGGWMFHFKYFFVLYSPRQYTLAFT
jgi:hypothetical protein